MNILYGSGALFIFDPDDSSNRPIPEYHGNALLFWPIYPQFLRDLFIKAFTEGIRDPQNGRVRETEWRGAMVKLRDSIVYCPHCGQENFYDADVIKQSGGKMNPCCDPDCKKEIRLPPRMRIDKNIIMLNHDTQLFPHHISNPLFDFSHPIAEVSQHPTNPSLWGIKNLSAEKWDCTTAAGELKEVEPNRSIPMAAGTKINFGQAEGEIRV
jgi:eukaryotic-like serine/threonine-protein kinase